MKFLSQIQNKVATGVAPMTVDSTTKVANLDVDKVDGYEGLTLSDILESGTSGTQHWVKYKDGTLLKYGTTTFTGAVSTAWGSGFTSAEQTLTFNTTIPFTTVPAVSVSMKSGTSTLFYGLSDLSTTLFKYVALRLTSLASSTITVSWKAVGRWN